MRMEFGDGFLDDLRILNHDGFCDFDGKQRRRNVIFLSCVFDFTDWTAAYEIIS